MIPPMSDFRPEGPILSAQAEVMETRVYGYYKGSHAIGDTIYVAVNGGVLYTSHWTDAHGMHDEAGPLSDSIVIYPWAATDNTVVGLVAIDIRGAHPGVSASI